MALTKEQLKLTLKHLDTIRQAKDSLTAEAIANDNLKLANEHLKRNFELDELIAAIKRELGET